MAGDFENFLQTIQQPQTATPTAAPVSPAAAPAPASTPFEDFVKADKAQQDAATTQQAQAVAVSNSTASPDAAGQAAQVARQINAPQSAVETDLPRYQAQALAQKNAQTLANSPKLAQWVANNPDSARIAQNDFDGMANVEPLFQDSAKTAIEPVLMGLAKGVAGGFNDASLAVNRLLNYGAQGIDTVTAALSSPTLTSLITGQKPGTQLSDWWTNNMVSKSLAIKGDVAIPDSANFGTKAAGVIGNLISMIATIGATGGTGAAAEAGTAASTGAALLQTAKGGARAMAFPALSSAVNTGQDVYNQTGDTGQAIRAAQMSYLTTTMGGIVPLGMPGGLGSRLAAGFVSGAVTGEVSRQAMNLVMPQQQGFDPEQMILSGLGGAVLGGTLGHPLHDGARQVFADGLNAETAEHGGQVMEQLSQIAQDSKLREHDPEAFKQFVRSSTEDGNMPNVYVDGKLFADALHQSQVDPSQIPGLAERLNEATMTGGDVQIPVEDYATHIAGTDLEKAILPNLKAEEGGMTYAEGQQFYADAATNMQAKAQEIVNQQHEITTQDTEVKAIGDNLADQMKATGRFPDDVVKASITPVAEFYRTMADRAGMRPSELYEQFPLQIKGENPVIDQNSETIPENNLSLDERIDTLVDEKRNLMEERKNENGQALVSGATPLENAISMAAGPSFIPEEADSALIWAKENGRQDIVDVITERAERVAQRAALAKSGLPESSPKYQASIDALKKYADKARADADRIAALADSKDSNTLHQENRGGFDPSSKTIGLLQNADLSTFLHEGGHFFLDTLGDLASRPDAPQQIKDDMQTAIEWMGGKDLADWNSKTLEQQRDMHEKFAQGFEQYLMEGKAPTQALQPIFARFRSWMLSVYQHLKSIGADLTPEVRGVFDRMLASDQAIQQTEQSRGYFPLDLSKTEATDKQQADYQNLGQQATQDAVSALQSRSVRDMQYASNAKSKALKAMQREAVSLRRGIQDEVTKEVMAQPIERVRDFLKTGETVDPAMGDQIKIAQGFKLNSDAIKEMYPDGMLARPDVEKLRGLISQDGLDPDQVAEIFGMPSGDQLVRSLIDAPPVKEQIAQISEQRMLERHGELTDPAAMDAAANEAVHNQARAKFMATGLKLLTKSPIPARELARAAEEAAHTTISAKRVGDLNPKQYEVAEAKANKEALLQAPKDTAKAIEAQRQALLSNRLAKASLDAVAEVKKIVTSQARYDKDSIRAKMDPDILEQIDALRERFDFRQKPPDGPTKQQVSLQKWVDAVKDIGYTPLENSDMLDASVRMHFKDMTVEQLRGFNDTIRSLETIARERKTITVNGKKVDLNEYVAEVNSKMEKKGEKFSAEQLLERPRLGTDPLFRVALDRLSSALRAAVAEFKGQQFKANQFDMHELLGPFSSGMFEPVFDSNYRKIKMSKEQAVEFRKVSSDLGSEWQKSLTNLVENKYLVDDQLTDAARKKDPDAKVIYRKLTRGDALVIAIRGIGNESNFDKMSKGMKWDGNDIMHFLSDTLSEKDLTAAQAVWDSYEKHWPEMVEMNKRLGNTSPDHIEARPFSITVKGEDGQPKTVSMRGGYAPISYDPIRSRFGIRKDVTGKINPADGYFNESYYRTDTTTNGSLNARNANYYDRIDLGYNSLENSLADTIHDLSYRETLLNIHKIMSHPEFRDKFMQTYGRENYDALNTWASGIAQSRNVEKKVSVLTSIMKSTRHMMVANGIALRASTLAKHGGSAAAKSASYFSGSGMKFIAARAFRIGRDPTGEISSAMGKFSEINARAMQQDRDYRQTTASLFKPEAFQSRAERFGHSFVAYADLLSAVPTAWAGYDRAITEGIPKNRGGTGKPMSEEDAVRYANQLVREAHGSNIESARSNLMQDNNELVKTMTTLYGFMNNSLGQTLDMADKLRTSGFSKPEVLARFMGSMIVPALIAGALTKHKDGESVVSWSAKAVVGEFAGMFPGVREAWNKVEGYSDAGLSPLIRTFEAVKKPVADVWKATHGKEVKAPIKDLGNAAGLVIPGMGQIGTTAQYAADVITGKEQPKGPVDVASGLALGHSNK